MSKAVKPATLEAVESATLEAARSGIRDSGWDPTGRVPARECKAARGHQARPEGVQEPSWGTAKRGTLVRHCQEGWLGETLTQSDEARPLDALGPGDFIRGHAGCLGAGDRCAQLLPLCLVRMIG